MRSRLVTRAFQWLLVTVVLSTVLVAASEGVLRAMNIHFPGLRFGDRSQDLWVFDRTKGWFHRPNFAAELPPGGPESGRVRTNALIVAMRQQAARLGSEFVVLNTGYRGERTELHQKLRPLLRRENVRLLGIEGNLDEARKRDPKGLWDFPNDIHWNVAAHDLVGQITFNFLEASRLLDDHRPSEPAGPTDPNK